MVPARGTWWLAVAMTAAWVMLVGPSAPGGETSAGSLPVVAARDAVPNRVMTWNICNPCEVGNVDRAAEIAAFAPQVIGLQEACVGDVEEIREHLENLYGLVYHVEYGPVLKKWSRCGGAPWNPGAYGQALLSAAPMTDVRTVEYPDGGSEDRGYMAVTTAVDGRPTRVFNTHLAQRRQESVRAGQTAVLAAAVGRYERVIVVGDFNAVPEAPELTGMWALATDTDPECRPLPTPTCRTTTDWQSKFDYVFLRGFTADEHRVRPSAYSDHHLVFTDLAPSSATG